MVMCVQEKNNKMENTTILVKLSFFNKIMEKIIWYGRIQKMVNKFFFHN